MAIMYRMLTCLLPTNKQHMYLRCMLFTSQVLWSFGAPSRNHSIVMFCSQAPPSQSTGHMKRQYELKFKTGGENDGTYRYTDESMNLIVSEIVKTSKTISTTGLKYDVLELGAGTGKITELLRQKLPEDMRYFTSEQSDNFHAMLKSKGLNLNVGLTAADSISLENRSAGNVLCAQSFHWLSDKENLDGICRVLAPGGKLILVGNLRQFENHSKYIEQGKQVVEIIGGSVDSLLNAMEWRKNIDASQDFRLMWSSLPDLDSEWDLDTIIA